MGKINIEFYDTENGKCPVADFIDSLEPKIHAKVLRTIDLLENNWNRLKRAIFDPNGRWDI